MNFSDENAPTTIQDQDGPIINNFEPKDLESEEEVDDSMDHDLEYVSDDSADQEETDEQVDYCNPAYSIEEVEPDEIESFGFVDFLGLAKPAYGSDCKTCYHDSSCVGVEYSACDPQWGSVCSPAYTVSDSMSDISESE